MRYVKWTLIGLLTLLVASFLHYTLPQTDIVRIVGTNTQRMDLGENSWFFAAPDSGTATTSGNRDVKFIETIRYGSNRPMVYRNEDTAWGWPPYFKFNSFDVQAVATGLVSTEAAPRWVAVRHYGWRNQFFTIFPNAISLRQVEDPEATIIPWINIVILSALALLIFMIRRMWLQFRERMVDPALIEAGEAWDRVDAKADAARDNARGFFGRIGAWLRTWRK
jgi:hypothetical protein